VLEVIVQSHQLGVKTRLPLNLNNIKVLSHHLHTTGHHRRATLHHGYTASTPLLHYWRGRLPEHHRHTRGSQSIFSQMRSPSRHSYKFCDITYRDAQVGEMIASEAFCHILRHFTSPLDHLMPELPHFQQKAADLNHRIWSEPKLAQIRCNRLDLMFPFSFRASEIWCVFYKFDQPHRLITNNLHNKYSVRCLTWSCNDSPGFQQSWMQHQCVPQPLPSVVLLWQHLCAENPVWRLILVLD
jgi:hypothetical protein